MDELPDTGFAVVRCADRAIIAYLESFPDCQRAMMYRKGDMVSFMPLMEDEVIGTPSMFTKLLERAGYRVYHVSGSS